MLLAVYRAGIALLGWGLRHVSGNILFFQKAAAPQMREESSGSSAAVMPSGAGNTRGMRAEETNQSLYRDIPDVGSEAAVSHARRLVAGVARHRALARGRHMGRRGRKCI